MEIKAQLSENYESFLQLIPESLLAGAIVIWIVLGLLIKARFSKFAIGAIVLLLLHSLLLWQRTDNPASVLFFGSLTITHFSSAFQFMINAGGILALIIALTAADIQRKPSEFTALMLSTIFGCHLLVMSNHYLVTLLSIEIISLSSYGLVAFQKNREGSEAALKYFLFGSAATAVMVYGFSFLYGITGGLSYSPANVSLEEAAHTPLLLIAIVFVLAGLLFKLGGAPLHLWSPDVYEGGPVAVVAFLSIVPKLAALAAISKFILSIHASIPLDADLQFLVAGLAMLSIAVGNFSALHQKNTRRMMAYSSIAQSGFLLVPLASFLPQGIHHMVFYAAVFVVMNGLAFLCIAVFERQKITTLEGYSGIGNTQPVLAIVMLVALIALTGLPPTAGFTGKLFIFSTLWESWALTEKPIILILFVFGLLNTVVSLFYYLRIPYFSFLKTQQTPIDQNNIPAVNLLGIFLVVLLLTWFFAPALLMGWINKINFAL